MIVVPKNQAENVLMAQWFCDLTEGTLETYGFDRNGNPLFQTLGFSRGGDLACVVLAHQCAPPNVFMAFAASTPRWASKENIRAVLIWAFNDLHCDRVTTVTHKRNRRSRKFQEGIGFQHEGKLSKASKEGDLIIYALTKERHEEWLRRAFHGRH